MQIALNSPARKWGLLGAALIFAASFLTVATREFLASHYSSALDMERLQKAAKLSPSTAEFHQTLGRYLFQVRGDLQSAVEEYRKAVRLNPYEAHAWLELAALQQTLDDVSGQREALEEAIRAEPTTPDVAWEAANFFLVRGENQRALREFRVVVGNEPSLAYGALQLSTRVADVETVVREVLPPDPAAYLTLIDVLTAKQDTAGAAKVWASLVQLHKPFETRSALRYVEYLISRHEVGQAHTVWVQTAQLCGMPWYLSSHDNLIVNSGFDSEILNSGFDWHYRKQPGVDLSLDPTDFHGGHRSLSINFDGPGVNEAGIFQNIPVDAATNYEFSAYYKSENVDGAGGPRLSIEDAYTGATYFLSDDLKDAEMWREAGGQFKTAPDAQLLRIRLLRVPYGSPIRGKLWIDDLRLIERR
jgi:hypothetical protein